IKRAEDLRGKTFAVTQHWWNQLDGSFVVAGAPWLGSAARQYSLSGDRRSGRTGSVRRERTVRRRGGGRRFYQAAQIKRDERSGRVQRAQGIASQPGRRRSGLAAPATPGNRRELHQRRNRSSGLFTGAEK